MTTETRNIIDYVRTRRNNGGARAVAASGLRMKFSEDSLMEAARTLQGVAAPENQRLRIANFIVDLMYRDTPFDNPPVNEGEQDARARV